MASEQPTVEIEPIRLEKLGVTISLSPETAKRLQEELPAYWEAWLELKRDLLEREANRISELLAERRTDDR